MDTSSTNEKKRKRQEKNKRRAQKKKAKKASVYSKVPQVQLPLAKKSVKDSDTEKQPPKSNAASSKAKKHGAKKVEKILESEVDMSHAGAELLKWMIAPMDLDKFMQEYYEKKPLLVKRTAEQREYFDGLLSSEQLKSLLEEKKLHYTRDFSITQYQDGMRKTLFSDSTAVADANKVWNLFKGKEKCSLRLLRPHNHSEAIWKIIAAFEGFWGSGCGSNAYLTPKASQGFAPHYDDIDAFILQLEGKKHWYVYDHYKRKDDEDQGDEDDGDEEEEEVEPEDLFPMYPLNSSEDFTEEQVNKNLKVAISATLEPGDFLYVPRGMVHQARALKDDHSLHLTISSGQRNSWADFLSLALPHAVEKCCRSDTAHDCAPLRQNLPRDFQEYMGISHSDKDNDVRREDFAEKVTKLIAEHILPNIDFDVIADRMSIRFQHDRHKPLGVLGGLPSTKHLAEREAEGEDSEEEADDDYDEAKEDAVTLDTKFLLAAKGVATLTVEGDAALLYHSCKNTTTCHETDQRGLEFDAEDAETIEAILNSDPCEPQTVRQLSHPLADDDKIRIVTFLAKERIVFIV